MAFAEPAVKVPVETFPFVAAVNSRDVNVRAGESENFERLCQLQEGEDVVVVGRNFSWYKIQLPKKAKSFVTDKYVQLISTAAGKITANRVNVRAGPDIMRTVLGQLDEGDEIHILEKLDGWYKIEPIEKSYGWVGDNFLVFKAKYNPEIRPATAAESVSGNEQKISQEVITITGLLVKEPKPPAPNLKYKIAGQDGPAYYMEGSPEIFEPFIHYQVKVEGVLKRDSQNQYGYPIIVVSKIQLVL